MTKPVSSSGSSSKPLPPEQTPARTSKAMGKKPEEDPPSESDSFSPNSDRASQEASSKATFKDAITAGIGASKKATSLFKSSTTKTIEHWKAVKKDFLAESLPQQRSRVSNISDLSQEVYENINDSSLEVYQK